MAYDKYYSILGLGANAPLPEIKKAYRLLAKRYHPDVNPDGHEKFIAINEAYELLMRLKQLEANRKDYQPPDEWIIQARERARERAQFHARQRMEQFRQSSIYRSARTVSFVFDVLFLLVGIAMCIIPVAFTDYTQLKPMEVVNNLLATFMSALFGILLITFLVKSRLDQYRNKDKIFI